MFQFVHQAPMSGMKQMDVFVQYNIIRLLRLLKITLLCVKPVQLEAQLQTQIVKTLVHVVSIAQ